MEDINWRFSDKFRSHWIKIKFYKDKPKLNGIKPARNIRFCEATNKALFEPILINKKSMSCSGAQHAFGWRDGFKNELLKNCNSKRKTQNNISKSMLSRAPYFKEPIEYIGLNTEGIPDMVLSYMPPQEVMDLVKIYHNRRGKNLDVSLCPMMSICGGIAVRTYLNEDISISFGCNDSRQHADIRRENLAVGIPRKLFEIFVD